MSGESDSVSFFLSLHGKSFVSVDEEGLLAERVNQDDAAAAVVSVRGETSVMILQMHTQKQRLTQVVDNSCDSWFIL